MSPVISAVPRFQKNLSSFSFPWVLLLAVMVFLLAAVASLLWFAYENELTGRQEQALNDTLWVKQNIEFQLNRHADTARGLAIALERGSLGAEGLSAKARVLLSNNRELVRIALLDAAGRPVLHEASYNIPFGTLDAALALTVMNAGQELYGAVVADDPLPLLRFGVPVLDSAGHAPQYVLEFAYSLEGLLNELVPWWLAQENEVRFANADGETLIVHPGTRPAQDFFRHQMPLGLDDAGLLLMLNSSQGRPGFIPHAMSAAVLLLTLVLMLSLMLLWRDMRRRADAESRLSEQLSLRQAMEDSLVTGLRARDVQGYVTYVNPAFCRMVGFTEAELLGKNWPMPFHDPQKIEALRQRFEDMLAGNITPEGHETEFIRKDGSYISVLIHEAPLINPDGSQAGWMSSILDITDRKRMEELNRQQQEKLQATARLVTMGEIASTLSHELNQPLSAITSYATGGINIVASAAPAQAWAEREGLLRQALERIQQQAERAGNIIRTVHSFVRRREPYKQPCAMARVIADTMPLIQLQARKWQVRLSTQVEPDLPLVEADAMMLELVLLNLTRNAIEAMADQPPERRILRIEVCLREAAIEVAVIDRGCGVALPEVDRLFSPFFTTKAEGMGMGLNICRTAIEFHRGRLWYEPTPGGGTTFRFTLQS